MAENYVNSRGMFEEQLRSITEALHQEVHLMEAMQKEPEKSNEMIPYLDLIRKNRQELVKSTFPNNINPNHWCLVKHSLQKIRHLEEVMQGAARNNPSLVPHINSQIKLAIKERDKALKLFMIPKTSGKDCVRCYDDLMIINENNEEKMAEVLNNINPHNYNEREIRKINMEGDKSMLYKEAGLIGAGQVVGKLVGRGVDIIPLETVQLYNKTAKALVGVGLVALASFGKPARMLKASGRTIATVAGTGLIVNAADEYASELLGTAPVAASLRSRRIVNRSLVGSQLKGRQFGQIPEPVRDEPALF